MNQFHWLQKYGLEFYLYILQYASWQSLYASSFRNHTELQPLPSSLSFLFKLVMRYMILILQCAKLTLSMHYFSCTDSCFSLFRSCKISSCVLLKIVMSQSSMRKISDGSDQEELKEIYLIRMEEIIIMPMNIIIITIMVMMVMMAMMVMKVTWQMLNIKVSICRLW